MLVKKIAGFLRATHIIHHVKLSIRTSPHLSKTDYGNNEIEQLLNVDSEYEELVERNLPLGADRNCYIIQPHIKWGPQKLSDITAADRLNEAKALIDTMPSWTVQDTISIPLLTFDKKYLFGTGNLDKLKEIIRRDGTINSVFINIGKLQRAQAINLEREFGVPIIDRYRMVIQILKANAISKHAKLQVALAELHYLRRAILKEGSGDRERIKMLFQNREQKLKSAINDLRIQRTLLRNNRQKSDFPVVAVVGYTNAGKTSLIKALTGEQQLKCKNQLFTTLDVTMHSGLLPSGLNVLYADTVGFISDIPTDLLECFIVTLEDAVLADVILHVEDISSQFYEFKRKHVLKTLEDLANKANGGNILNKIVSVGNKSDLAVKDQDFNVLRVSAETETGLDVLRMMLERKIMEVTNRKRIKIRVPSGGSETRWLYKNCTVVSETPDKNDPQIIIADVIITNSKLQQFKHCYV